MSAAAPLKLYTFAMSHYSEKIRWTLDASQLPYREVCMTPVFHILPALLMGKRGQTTLPIVQHADGAIQDSPRILQWLDARHGPLAVMPRDQMQAISEAQRRFDAIGKDVARFLYAKGFGVADDHILRLWTDFASPWQAGVVRLFYPLIRWAFKIKLQINLRRTALAQQRITAAMDWLESQLASGRPYLAGDTFTVADITAASLLAPIACPAAHPVYSEASYQSGMAAAIDPWRQRPALVWVRAIYAQHRGQMQGGVFNT